MAEQLFLFPIGDALKWDPKIDVVYGERNRKYLEMVYSHAWNNSDDPMTKTGAVIVTMGLEKVIAYGANHFPSGFLFQKSRRKTGTGN